MPRYNSTMNRSAAEISRCPSPSSRDFNWLIGSSSSRRWLSDAEIEARGRPKLSGVSQRLRRNAVTYSWEEVVATACPAGQMKRKRFAFSRAQQEINEAFDWYFERNPKRPTRFSLKCGIVGSDRFSAATLSRLHEEHPQRVLQGFPYSVIFQEKDDAILVVAVAHAKLRPGYWRGATESAVSLHLLERLAIRRAQHAAFVTMAVTYFAGVTSKAGLQMPTPFG